jgi:hypothetical protein
LVVSRIVGIPSYFSASRTISIKLLAGRCLDAGSKPIEMLESSGEVSNVEWIKLGESLVTDKDADRLNRDGSFDGHPKPDCPQLAVGYGFARTLDNERHGGSPSSIQPKRANGRNDFPSVGNCFLQGIIDARALR